MTDRNNFKGFFRKAALSSVWFGAFSLLASLLWSAFLGDFVIDLLAVVVIVFSLKLLWGHFWTALWLRWIMLLYALMGAGLLALPFVLELAERTGTGEPFPPNLIPWAMLHGAIIGAWGLVNMVVLWKKWNRFFATDPPTTPT